MGSNIDSQRNMQRAAQQLAAHCTLLALSPVYQTAPVGKTDQPPFLNAAAWIETDLSAAELKEQVLQPIEHALGRVRGTDKNAPRTIDLDITLFNDQVMQIGQRHIPDPELVQHAHIAIPLADLAPQYRHPETGQTLRQIADRLANTTDIQRIQFEWHLPYGDIELET